MAGMNDAAYCYSLLQEVANSVAEWEECNGVNFMSDCVVHE